MLIKNLHHTQKKKIKKILNKSKVKYSIKDNYIELRIGFRNIHIYKIDTTQIGVYSCRMNFDILSFASLSAQELADFKNLDEYEVIRSHILSEQESVGLGFLSEITLLRLDDKIRTLLSFDDEIKLYAGDIFDQVVKVSKVTILETLQKNAPDLLKYFEELN